MPDRCILSIAICICTYDRDDGLRRALAAIARQDLPDELRPHVRVVVVDNYGQGAAAGITKQAAAASPFPVSFHVEPDRNISAARNAAIDAAGFVDMIAFVDDDEEPEPGWLAGLVDRFFAGGADIVLGPVPTRYPPGCPHWIRDGGYFDVNPAMLGVADPARYRIVGGTGNMLARRMVYDVLGPAPFDRDFGRTGGGDTELFVRALRAGFSIAGAPDAVAWTDQDPDRLSARFLLRRSFTRGQNYMLILLRHFGRGFAALSRSYMGDVLLIWPAVRVAGFVRRNWRDALTRAANGVRAAFRALARGDFAAIRDSLAAAARRAGKAARALWRRLLARFRRPAQPGGAFGLLLYGVNVAGQVWAFAGLPVRYRY